METRLQKGDKAPIFELLDQSGNLVKLSDFIGTKVLVYFYPRASTPGCTIQACKIRDAYDDFSTLGLSAIGISPDASEKQMKFDNKHSLKFPLLADRDCKVAGAFGVWVEKSIFGKKYMGILRSSFLIDEQGYIIKSYYKISPMKTVSEALKELSL